MQTKNYQSQGIVRSGIVCAPSTGSAQEISCTSLHTAWSGAHLVYLEGPLETITQRIMLLLW